MFLNYDRYSLLQKQARFGWLIKAKIKAHYRKLPNGKVIRIEEYYDKRTAAKKDPKKFRGHVVHVDDKNTTIVNSKGEMVTHEHDPRKHELTQDHIHGELNRAVPIDDSLAERMVLAHLGIDKDSDEYEQLLNGLSDSWEGKGEKPEPEDIFSKKYVKPLLKKLQKQFGDSSSLAEMYQNGDETREYLDHLADSEHDDYHGKALAKMAQDHSDSAIDELAKQQSAVEKAQALTKKDCPKIANLDPKLKLFGHQAEVLAKLNVLPKAIIDVDMGGGKGLLLPADAMNLMAQGKVKKPLIIAPTNTVEQNALKVINEYGAGSVNVFKITNQTINDVYGGDVEKMVEDIHNAPPNTIFVAGYDAFSYQKRGEDGKIDRGPDQFERARTLSAANFDYCALDESHNVKNAQSNRWKSLQYLTSAKYKRLASGTFISNNPRDVIGQLKWLHPSANIAEDKFKEKYGYEESSEGVRWDENGMKQLREDMGDMGLISIRRSGWIHLLPKRDENVSIAKMSKEMNAIHETCVTGILDHLEKELMENPRFRKRIEAGEDIDSLIEASPKFQNALNVLGGVTDYPSEMANMINESVKLVLSAKKKADEGDEEEDDDENEAVLAAQELLRKLPPPIRKAIQGLEGVVSPKALDCYEKMREHLKDTKNGKFIVMTQRKLSCQHILDNMPEDLKKHAMYYDASQAHRLKEFTDDDSGPKILVAVDASITEGINMQKANGLYRYDHKYSPGAQEQSYARVWRFGQNRPVKIFNGIVDNGVDVTKYCRMMTKHHANMLATSELPKTPTDVAYKLSLENIRNNRSASIVPKYEDMGKSIIAFQQEENKGLRKRFGDEPQSYSGEATIGGKAAQQMHGSGAYQTEYTGSDKSAHLDDQQLDDMVGHVRDSIRKHLDSVGYDTEVWQTILPAAIELAERHKMKKGMGKDIDESTWDSFVRENPQYDDTEKGIILHAVNKLSKRRKHKGHADDPDEAVRTVLNDLDLPVNKDAHGAAIEDVESLRKWMKKKKVTLDYEGIGSKVANSKELEEFWKWWEKKFDDKQSKTYRNIIESAAGLLSHHEGGWSTMKDQMGMFLKGKRSA